MISTVSSPLASRPADPLREKAAQLETAFLSQMLGEAGLGAASGTFGGGAGEAQFASFLRDEQARAMVDHGGIGLTESLFRAMGGKE
ncbi:rod-binding protein [Falsirhodobacter sp. 20TX0035]|uniref:rod-binding protein n=1 Tax=Falsirhodobacter sp. 20TX0035 TaxID=3022019 RepID=UPI00232FCCBC|nr:rod-binding protein [Falsirhodobacter sp. 20TX0035]MDB6452497.1 rod-binding protein [Falsirhodobacter sp. 20TX0035]